MGAKLFDLNLPLKKLQFFNVLGVLLQNWKIDDVKTKNKIIFWEIWDNQIVEQFIAVTKMCGFYVFPLIAYELQPFKKCYTWRFLQNARGYISWTVRRRDLPRSPSSLGQARTL